MIGTLLLLFSAPISLFPRRLPKEGTDACLQQVQGPESVKEHKFRSALCRLLRNRLYMLNFLSGLCFVFAFVGFGTFMPKYIQYQFRKRPSEASVYSGAVGVVSKAIGLLVSGVVLSRWRPSARTLSAFIFNVLVGSCYLVFFVTFSMLDCPDVELHGVSYSSSVDGGGAVDFSSGCNDPCDCPSSSRPDPVCSEDGTSNFFSPCLAGVRRPEVEDDLRELQLRGRGVDEADGVGRVGCGPAGLRRQEGLVRD